MKKLLSLIFVLTTFTSFAQLKVARLFSEHAVLQRQKPLPVWGWAVPSEKVTVQLASQTQSTVADASGKWQVTLAAMEAGGPFQLKVTAKSGSLLVNDILLGDIWLCSGQSNMEWKVAQTDHFQVEKQNANYPNIRHFEVQHEVSLTPQQDLNAGDWKVSNTETVGGFTAVGFFFAREIYQKTNVPIGILHTSWGGSQVESWISQEAMLESEELRAYAQTFPKSWEEADAHLEKLNKRKTLGDANASPTLADEKKYLQANYDFSKWLTADPMGQWDWKGIWAWRGNGFMAKTVEIPAEMVTQSTTLGLAACYSYNEVYINGQLVSAGVFKDARKLLIPANTWKAGKNNIMVKMNQVIEPQWYGLGLSGSSADLFVSSNDQKISLAGPWKLMPSFAEPHTHAHLSNNAGVIIYNSMIHPLLPFGIKGALWYQGESNASRAYQYRKTFPLMIQDWRKRWGYDFPFYFVQLATYGAYQNSNQGSDWAELREAQTMTLSLPKTGMAITTDVGNPTDIHPTNKQDVGHRLALNALLFDYGQAVLHTGPTYESVKFEDGKATLSFKYTGKGLIAKDKFGYLKGFEIAGDDKVFYYAKAEIIGNQVVVYYPKGQKPASVRYAWANSPLDANLFNADGLPACPFRTDTWKGITEAGKFE